MHYIKILGLNSNKTVTQFLKLKHQSLLMGEKRVSYYIRVEGQLSLLMPINLFILVPLKTAAACPTGCLFIILKLQMNNESHSDFSM